ncbi:MAG: DNA gyrase subunit A [Anaerolineales bacterium]|nr:DNA gyrase subunit A [Anaerolineales bacterium]
MEIGMVRRIDIDAEMQQSYLDYAMSVIVSRALPDARDGLKPVHRRILYSMESMGIRPDSSYKKSARIVGDVLGKYHPHGDAAVYDAMARLAQDFSMRYPLVTGQGNFGSVDGDPPAAMRYTEARMAQLAAEMLLDLDEDTVNFTDNFDGSLQEPGVLPSAIPNLLVNGATGIAVGMATSIPPHNMTEVCDALIFMLENWSKQEEISISDLMKYIKGPDFPTGGIILHGDKGREDLQAAYGSGRGRFTVQARAHIEDMARGRTQIIVTELPYQTNKSNLIEKIADLARAGQLEGLSDLRDESDRQGMRIVLELSKNADPEKILSNLYRKTPMQSTFSLIMLALVDDQPRLLTLKQALRVYLEHRLEVVRRRTEYRLDQARKREHILAGLRVALKNLDEVIELIRSSRTVETARTKLMQRFKLSQIQAQAILDMPLRRLANLEQKKIETEYREIVARIKEFESLLRSKEKMLALIASELTRVKETFGDRRRTQIVHAGEGEQNVVLTASDLAPSKDTWVSIYSDGTICRSTSARLPRLSGRSVPDLVIGASVQDTLYLFDANGNAAAIAVHTIPESDDPEGGKPVASVTPFDQNDEITAGIALPSRRSMLPGTEGYIAFVTRLGMIKKSPLDTLPGPSAHTFEAVKVNAPDRLAWVFLTNGSDDIWLASSEGLAIRFTEGDVRPMGLSAAGVNGMKFDPHTAYLVGAGIVEAAKALLLLTETGLGKRCAFGKFPRQGRYGKGVLVWKSGTEVKTIGAASGKGGDRAIVRLSKGASKSLRFSDAPSRTRAAAGSTLIDLKEKVLVVQLHAVQARPEILNQGK